MYSARATRELFLLPLCLAAPVFAQQSEYVVPGGRNYENVIGTIGMANGLRAIPGATTAWSRAQMVYDKSGLGFSSGNIEEIAFRRDAVLEQSYAAMTRNVIVRLAHTSHAPKGMPFEFDAVPDGGTLTEVFNGPVNFPAAPFIDKRPYPWALVFDLDQPWSYDANQGNLMLDIASTGPYGVWNVDAINDYSDGQAATLLELGSGCMTSESLEFDVQTFPHQAATGLGWQCIAQNIPDGTPLAIGYLGAPLAGAFDLTALGAPGCAVYLNPLCGVNYQVMPTRTGSSEAYAHFFLPNEMVLVNQTVLHQWAIPDAQANALGVVTSDGLEVTIGRGPSHTYLVNTNRAPEPQMRYGRQTGAEYGPIVRFKVDAGGAVN